MDWITSRIAIGDFREARDPSALAAADIRSVLSLDGSLLERSAKDLGVARLESVRLVDGRGNAPDLFLRAVATLASLVEESPPVLVHCHAGRSRSPVVVAGYLLQSGAHALPEEALRFVGARREIAVTPGLEPLLDRI